MRKERREEGGGAEDVRKAEFAKRVFRGECSWA
jgi:hypothetical protein